MAFKDATLCLPSSTLDEVWKNVIVIITLIE